MAHIDGFLAGYEQAMGVRKTAALDDFWGGSDGERDAVVVPPVPITAVDGKPSGMPLPSEIFDPGAQEKYVKGLKQKYNRPFDIVDAGIGAGVGGLTGFGVGKLTSSPAWGIGTGVSTGLATALLTNILRNTKNRMKHVYSDVEDFAERERAYRMAKGI